MDLPAILLLLVAALTHSAWNLLAKGSRDKQVFLFVLREPFGEKKVAGAVLIFAGILCIGLAG